MFVLCFAVFVAATSAATVCKCEDKKVNATNKSDFLKFNILHKIAICSVIFI